MTVARTSLCCLLLGALFLVPVSSFAIGACCQTAEGNCEVVDSTDECAKDAQWSYMTGTCINNKCEATFVAVDPKPIRPGQVQPVAACSMVQEVVVEQPAPAVSPDAAP